MDCPTLYHFRVAHYSEKVRWALDYKGVPHRRRALPPGFHLPHALLLTGKRTLPILRLNGRAIRDSTAILAELERLHPEPALYPADLVLRERALAIEDYYDEEVAPALRRLFWSTYMSDATACARMATDGFGAATRLAWRALWPVMRPLFLSNMQIRPEPVQRARQALGGYFDRLEADTAADGFHVGGSFSLADLTAAAVMTALIRPPEFSYPLPEPWPPALVELRESLAERPGFKWVLDVYRRFRPIAN
ncbi:MAG: hypothetical protein AMXMBFR33_28280 [Candidatus Xenobia bacterium]